MPFPAALLALLLLALPAHAQIDPDDDWELQEPKGVEADDGASAAERSVFWDESQRQLLIRFCWQLKIKLRPGGVKLWEGLPAGGAYNRHLRHLPSGALAIVDQGMLHLPLDPGYTVKTLANGAFFPLGVSALIDGRSTVVRPLAEEKTCRQLRKDPALREIKTVLPLEAPRIAAMTIGELWQLPLTLKYGGKGSAVVPLGSLQAAVSLTYSRKGFASVTLYRLADDRLRLRLRLDQAEVYDARGALVAMFPIAQLGLPLAEALIGRTLDPDLARQVNEYLGPRIGVHAENVTGERGLLEYILDPRDAAQMETLAALLRGDLDGLFKLAFRRTRLEDLAATHAALPAPSFQGTDSYRDKKRKIGVGLPLIADWDGAARRGQDDIVVLGDDEGRYLLSHRGRTTRSGGFGTPEMGHIQERRKQRLVQAIVPLEVDGSSATPVAVYVQQESFISHGDRRIRRMIRRVDELMSWVGREKGVAPRLPTPEGLVESSAGAMNRWGAMSFTLLFNQTAVRDILASGNEAVERAATAIGARARAGRALAADIRAAAAATTPEEQARALTELMSGKGARGLPYESVMKILVQLVDPADLAAEFVLQADRRDRPDIVARYAYHAGGQSDPVLAAIRRIKARFSPPTWLGD